MTRNMNMNRVLAKLSQNFSPACFTCLNNICKNIQHWVNYTTRASLFVNVAIKLSRFESFRLELNWTRIPRVNRSPFSAKPLLVAISMAEFLGQGRRV